MKSECENQNGGAIASKDLLGVLKPVLDWYQSDEQPKRELIHIVSDIVADLQDDRTQSLRMSAALRKIVSEFDALNGTECSRGCGKCIRCIARAALDTPNAKLKHRAENQ